MIRFVLLGVITLAHVPALMAQKQCVLCTTPDRETSQAIRHSVDPGFNTAYVFVQTLVFTTNPGSVDTGATVVEDENATGTDGCYFNGSPFAPVTRVSGGTWTVGVPDTSDPDGSGTVLTANQWGPDTVGYSDTLATYYFINGAKLGKLPCGFHFYQNLTITCPNQTPIVFDINVNLTDTITSGGGQSCREGACGPVIPL